MRKITAIAIAVVVGAMFPADSRAQDYQAAAAAYEAGDYDAALRELRLLAEQGNARAQSNLGNMYYNGRGVPQNYVSAYMWWNLAAAQGHENTQANRDIVQRRMTSADITRAQKLAEECLARNYQGC